MLKHSEQFTLKCLQACFLSFLVIASVATAQAVQPFTKEKFVKFTGVLPNGEFRFAVEVLEDIPASESFSGIPKGAFITNIRVNFPKSSFVTEGPPEMIELLVNLAPGSTAIISFVEAETGTASRISFEYQYTAQQRAEFERNEALEEAKYQERLRADRENVYVNGKCDRSKVVYCEWGMPNYGQLGDNVHMCNGVRTSQGVFAGSYSKCSGLIGWCNPWTGKRVHCR